MQNKVNILTGVEFKISTCCVCTSAAINRVPKYAIKVTNARMTRSSTIFSIMLTTPLKKNTDIDSKKYLNDLFLSTPHRGLKDCNKMLITTSDNVTLNLLPETVSKLQFLNVILGLDGGDGNGDDGDGNGDDGNGAIPLAKVSHNAMRIIYSVLNKCPIEHISHFDTVEALNVCNFLNADQEVVDALVTHLINLISKYSRYTKPLLYR